MRIAKRLYMLYYGLYRRSIVPLWAHMPGQCLDYPIHKTTNIWHSIDAHFHDGVTYMSCTVSVEKAAIPSYMNHRNKAIVRSAKMQDHQSLMLDWCSLSGWSGSVLLLFFPLKAGNTSLMDVCFESPVRLPKIQDQKSLTLHWRSYSGWGWECVANIFPTKGSHYLIYGFVQPITSDITKMQHGKLMTLRWHSSWGCGRERVTIVFARESSQYIIYGCLQPIDT